MPKSINAIRLLAIRQGANLVLSLVRIKILALLLGPAGIGVLSQATNLLDLFRGTAASGTNNAVTVLVADAVARKAFERINRILVTASVFLAIIGSLIISVCLLLSGPIADGVFGNKAYANFVIVVGAAGWIAIQLSLITGLFRGLLKIRVYTFSFVAGFLSTIVATVFLVLMFGLTGAVLSILVGQAITYLIAYTFFQLHVRKQYPEIRIVNAKPSWNVFRQINKYFGPLFLIFLVGGIGNLILRSEIIHRLGEGANGYYQVSWGISLAYMTLIEDTRRSYLFPRIASCLHNRDKINHIQNRMLRLYMITLSPFLIALLAFRESWIPILYSREFLVASSLLVWQFAGDLLATFRIIITASLVPKEKFGYLIFERCLLWIVWIGFSFCLMPRWGLVAIPAGYFAVNLMLAMVGFAYQHRVTRFYLNPDNRRLLLKLLPMVSAGMAGTYMIASIPLRLVFATAAVGSLALWLPDATEKREVFDWLKRRVDRVWPDRSA